jgi:dTMP kinase
MKAAATPLLAVAESTSKSVKTPERSYPGVLLAVEGVEGSGRSTQLHLLSRWLEMEGYLAHFAEWHPSPLVESAVNRPKGSRWLTPITFAVIHAADFADRYERQILPSLRSGHIVLVDGYIHAALARDSARGCPMPWLRNLYKFAVAPDITFYIRVPLDVAVQRALSGRPRLKYYDAGMDLGLSLNRIESFRIFQGKIIEEYEKLAWTDNFLVLNGTLPVQQLQQYMRGAVSSQIDLKRFRTSKIGAIPAQLESEMPRSIQESPEAKIAEEIAPGPVQSLQLPDFFAGDGFPERAHEINGLIAQRAYELFVARGSIHGHEREDWRRAESEIIINVAVDITETETEVIIRAELPGFSKQDLQIKAKPRALCISGKRPQESDPAKGKILYSERRAAQVFRVLDLPSEIDPENLNFTLSNGILEIRLQKARKAEKVRVLAKAAAA